MTYSKYHNYQSSKRNIHAAIGGWVVLIGIFIIGFGFLKTKEQEQIVLPVRAEEPKEEFRINCTDNLAEYLECKAVNEVITYDEAEIMLAIAKAESGLNPNAIHVNTNGTVDRGIYQINSIHKNLSNEDAFDWQKNADFAINMMKKQGFRPWVVYNNGVYKLFLPK